MKNSSLRNLLLDVGEDNTSFSFPFVKYCLSGPLPSCLPYLFIKIYSLVVVGYTNIDTPSKRRPQHKLKHLQETVCTARACLAKVTPEHQFMSDWCMWDLVAGRLVALANRQSPASATYTHPLLSSTLQQNHHAVTLRVPQDKQVWVYSSAQ